MPRHTSNTQRPSTPSRASARGRVDRAAIGAKLNTLRHDLLQSPFSSAVRHRVDPTLTSAFQELSDKLYAQYPLKREIVSALYEAGHDDLAQRVDNCGAYFEVETNERTGQQRTKKVEFCERPLFCAACAARLNPRKRAECVERFRQFLSDYPTVQCSFVTFTIRARADLTEALDHLSTSLTTFNDKAGRHARGDLKCWPVNCAGALNMIQIKRTDDGRHWHCHAHSIIAHLGPINKHDLHAAWHRITGDSFGVHVEPLYSDGIDGRRSPEARIEALLADIQRLYRYATDHSCLSLPERLEVHDALTASGTQRAAPLIRKTGALRGPRYAPAQRETVPIEGDPADIHITEVKRQSNGKVRPVRREERGSTPTRRKAVKRIVKKERKPKKGKRVKRRTDTQED